MEPLTILIADDHPVFRKGLRALLASMQDVELVGEATTGEEAIRLAEQLQPDVILMDLQMPGGGGSVQDPLTAPPETSFPQRRGGLPAIRQIVQTSPHIRILVVTMFQDDDSVFAALRAGARGYILKDMDDEDITRAILAVGRGEAIFSPAIAERIIGYFAARPSLPTGLFPELTESERSVLALMARGVNNEEIARQLSFSPKTVRNYVSNIFSKLQVADRAQAIVKAREAGLQ